MANHATGGRISGPKEGPKVTANDLRNSLDDPAAKWGEAAT